MGFNSGFKGLSGINVEGHCYPSDYQLLLYVSSLANTKIFYGLLMLYFF